MKPSIILLVGLALFSSFASCSSTNVMAQQSSQPAETETTPPNENGYVRTRINIVNLGAIINTTDNRAFVIARLGTGEHSRRLIQNRFACVRFVLQDSLKTGQVIFAEGERVKGLGRIEFYLGNELMNVALIGHNGSICPTSWNRRGLLRRFGAPN